MDSLLKKEDIVEELKIKYTPKKKIVFTEIETTGKDSQFYISKDKNVVYKKSSSSKGNYCVVSDNYTKVCSSMVHEIIIHSILNAIKHPNIIELQNVIYQDNHFYLQMPKIEKIKEKYNEEVLQKEIITQTSLIIGHLQNLFEFTHNDLKLDNILIQEVNKKQKIQYKINNKKITYTPKIPIIIKLIDFGHSMINNYNGMKIYRYFNTEFINNRFKDYESKLPNIPKELKDLFAKMFYFYRFQNFIPHMDLEKFIKRTKVFPSYLKNLEKEKYLPINLYKILNK